jgi:hypothetical protein
MYNIIYKGSFGCYLCFHLHITDQAMSRVFTLGLSLRYLDILLLPLNSEDPL